MQTAHKTVLAAVFRHKNSTVILFDSILPLPTLFVYFFFMSPVCLSLSISLSRKDVVPKKELDLL